MLIEDSLRFPRPLRYLVEWFPTCICEVAGIGLNIPKTPLMNNAVRLSVKFGRYVVVSPPSSFRIGGNVSEH